MSVNVKGTLLCCQVFGGAMAARGKGSIVNIASIYGMVSPDQSLYQYRRDRGEMFYKPVAYSASKSALYNLTRYLATYWGGKGVRVNTLTLGGVFNNQDPAFLERYNAKVPLGRMADVSEYNGVVQFLLSDAASYVTGSNIVARRRLHGPLEIRRGKEGDQIATDATIGNWIGGEQRHAGFRRHVREALAA